MKHFDFHRRLLTEEAKWRSYKKKSVSDQLDKGEDGEDEEEEEPEELEENVYSLGSPFFTTLSMVTYVTDVISSISVCYLLASIHPIWWFVMSVIPLIVSLIIVNLFSIRWYIHDYKEGISSVMEASETHWALRGIFHIVLLGPVIRYMELFVYGAHSREVSNPLRKDYKTLVLQEDRDTSLLAMVGSFIKSAPQLVLQIYILTKKNTEIEIMTSGAQITSVVLSLLELAMSLTTYHRALRRSIPGKKRMTKAGCAMQFLSHCCIIGCRVFTLAAFASQYEHWLLVFCVVHWAVMTSWLIFQKTTFCTTASGERRLCEEILFNFVVGIIYVFCFLNVKEERTRWKYTFYYSVVLAENIALVMMWFWLSKDHEWYSLHLLIGSISSFAVGILILTVYYRFFHPNKVGKDPRLVKMPYPETLN